MIRRVQWAVTETAISYLHTTYLDLTGPAITVAPPKRGRILRSTTALGEYDFKSASGQGCFLRMVSIVEVYVDIVCTTLFQESVPTTHDLIRRLVEDAELRASTTWNERKSAFSVYHKILLGEFRRWSELDAVIEVRNSIAHGLGKLTPRQRGSNVQSKMSQIGVIVSDGNIAIDEASLRQCRDICIEFVRYLDEKSH